MNGDVQVRFEVYPWKRDSITLSTMDLKHSIYYLNKISANLFILAKYTQFCWVSNLSRLSSCKCSYNSQKTKQGFHLILVQAKLIRTWSLYFYFYVLSIFYFMYQAYLEPFIQFCYKTTSIYSSIFPVYLTNWHAYQLNNQLRITCVNILVWSVVKKC